MEDERKELANKIKHKEQEINAIEKDRVLLKKQIGAQDARVKALGEYLLDKTDIRHLFDGDRQPNHTIRNLSDKDWDEIRFVLNEADGDFVNRLIAEYPALTTDDLWLCMLLRLNLSNSMSAEIFHLSTQYIKQRQTSLKNKLNIAESSLSLRKFIGGF